MNKQVKHLYIHIPFCNSICSYCDFVRFVSNERVKQAYINKILEQIKRKHFKKQFETIYIGGGTPNCLSDKLLNKLLHALNKYLVKKYEFTIECNPELLTKSQITILKQNNVNRVSIGVQTTNDKLLRQMQRKHTFMNVIEGITNLRKAQIHNISLDFIYGFNEMIDGDLMKAISFIKKFKIPHVSWYALEVKDNSILAKRNYQTHEELIEKQMALVIKYMCPYERYEISSWCLNKKYQSQHNKAYWLSHDWIAIGLGACGLENKIYYENKGDLTKWSPYKKHYSLPEYYFHIMLMGLRLKEGLDLKNDIYKKAYLYFKDKLKYVKVKNNHLVANNINTIDSTLIELI